MLLLGAVIFLPALAQTFPQRPLTEGLHQMTAHPLNGGEVRIGDLWLPFDVSQLKWLAIDYGLTSDLQLGTALPANFTGTLNLLAKYRLWHLASTLDFSIPFSFTLTLGEAHEVAFSSGLLFSGMFEENLGYHAGLWFLVSSAGGSGISSFYVITDLTLHPDAKLLVELDLYPGAVDSLQISIGELQRFGVVNLRFAATWALPSGANVLEAALFFRF